MIPEKQLKTHTKEIAHRNDSRGQRENPTITLVEIQTHCINMCSVSSLCVSVQHASTLAESVHDVESSDRLALAVLSVRHAVTDNALHERLEDPTDLFVHDSADALDTTTARKAANCGLCDSADVVLQCLLLAFRAVCALSITRFLAFRHLK